MLFIFCRPADALLSSEPGGVQGTLATDTVAQDGRFFLFFFVMHVVWFLCAMRFRLGTSAPRGTVGCATFSFRVSFRLLSRSPRSDGSLREVSDFGFPCLLQFAFLRLAPPRHAAVTREGFDGGRSCHSAFSSRPLRQTGGTRQVFCRVVCLHIASAFP